MKGPRLAWVVVEGAFAPVGRFAGLSPAERPPAACPVCHMPVVLKLGDERIHHAAHTPGSTCAATRPETALHLNTKLHVAAQLKGASPLTVVEECAAGLVCERARLTTRWAQGWDRVEVETTVGSARPDILLLRADTPVAAIEVFASHRIDAAKARLLAQLGLPWVEVKASESLYLGDKSWVASDPLPIWRRESLKRWTCDPCEQERERLEEEKRRLEEERLAAEEQNRRRKEEEEVRRQTVAASYSTPPVGIVRHRVADYYYKSGSTYRDVFTIERHVSSSGEVTLSLWRTGSDAGPVTAIRGEESPDTARALARAFRRVLRQAEERGAIVDSPMRWAEGEGLVHSSMIYSENFFPRRYIWSWRNEKWFLGKEYRGYRWDEDAFDDYGDEPLGDRA